MNGDVLTLKSKVTNCETEIRDVTYKLQSSEQYAYSLRKDLDEKEKQIGDTFDVKIIETRVFLRESFVNRRCAAEIPAREVPKPGEREKN